jgi:hypothetical protein
MPGRCAGTRLQVALLLLLAGCAVVVGGCARPAGSGGPSGGDASRSQPHTVTVTARDAGRFVTLHRGERLDVALGIVQRTGQEWQLVSYPLQLLSLLPGPVGHFQFTAVAPGRGVLTASPVRVCAPTDNPDPLLCPPGRTGPVVGQQGPGKLFTLTIQVA